MSSAYPIQVRAQSTAHLLRLRAIVMREWVRRKNNGEDAAMHASAFNTLTNAVDHINRSKIDG